MKKTYEVPTVSSLLNNLTPTDNLSNIAKGIWLKEQVMVAIQSECTSTLFDNIEQAIEALPKGKEKIERVLPSGQRVTGERNARQNAKKSLTTAFKNAVKDWKENSPSIYEKFSGVNLAFNQSKPMFKEKVAPATYEEKLFKMLCDCLTVEQAHAQVNATLKEYGKAYWGRKTAIKTAQEALDIETIVSQYNEYLGMGMKADTARNALKDIHGELAEKAIQTV